MSFLEVNAHKRIAALCEELANEVYEVCASKYDNWYHQNPDRKAFVRICAPTLKAEAKRIMGTMLSRDDVDPKEKELIYESLCLDNQFPSGGVWNAPTGHA